MWKWRPIHITVFLHTHLLCVCEWVRGVFVDVAGGCGCWNRHPATNTSPTGLHAAGLLFPSLFFLCDCALWANSPIPFILSCSYFFLHQQDATRGWWGGGVSKTFFIMFELKLSIIKHNARFVDSTTDAGVTFDTVIRSMKFKPITLVFCDKREQKASWCREFSCFSSPLHYIWDSNINSDSDRRCSEDFNIL